MRDTNTDKLNKIKTLAIIFPDKIKKIYLFLLIVLPYSLIPFLILPFGQLTLVLFHSQYIIPLTFYKLMQYSEEVSLESYAVK